MNVFSKKEEKKKRKSEAECFKIIEDWMDFFECRLTGNDREGIKKDLWVAVQRDRLELNESNEEFKYVLIKPIQKAEGAISIIKMKESDMDGKEEMSRIKNEHARGISMLQKYCMDGDDNEIPAGFIGRIKDRDKITINAIILGFFVQAVPRLGE